MPVSDRSISTSAIELYVKHVDQPLGRDYSVYVLHHECSRENRLAVLCELLTLYGSNNRISMVGDEVYVPHS